MLCEKCNQEISEDKLLVDNNEAYGIRSWFATVILSLFTGVFGFHRFYTNHVKTGIIQALTLGGFGIWTFIDFIIICLGKFRTKEDKRLTGYNETLGIALIVIKLTSFSGVIYKIIKLIPQ